MWPYFKARVEARVEAQNQTKRKLPPGLVWRLNGGRVVEPLFRLSGIHLN
jgi:hypothetical protein